MWPIDVPLKFQDGILPKLRKRVATESAKKHGSSPTAVVTNYSGTTLMSHNWKHEGAQIKEKL